VLVKYKPLGVMLINGIYNNVRFKAKRKQQQKMKWTKVDKNIYIDSLNQYLVISLRLRVWNCIQDCKYCRKLCFNPRCKISALEVQAKSKLSLGYRNSVLLF
jgi:hypothetical protein